MTTTDLTPERIAERYAIRADRLFDGLGFRAATDIVVEAGRIVAVHGAGEVASDLPVVELGDGVTLLPGLIDTHMHLVFDASWRAAESIQEVPDDDLARQMRERARTALAAGITTVRDLGDRRYLSLPLRDELAGRPDAGPQVLCAGPPITTTRGHCWFLGGEVAGPAGLREAVAERAERGVDVVKVMATGGEMTAGSHAGMIQFDEAALRMIVDEARRHGLPVAAHAHAPSGIASALAAGVDTIEHCSFLTGGEVEPDDDLIDAIAASGVVVSMTVGMAPVDATPPEKITRLPKLDDDLVRRIATSGAVVTVGSDAGVAPMKPHDVVPYGVAVLADLVGDRASALAAATSVAARACGLADRKGRLAPGYDADLVAVRGDLAADLRALHDVAAVYRSGVQVAGRDFLAASWSGAEHDEKQRHHHDEEPPGAPGSPLRRGSSKK